MNELLGKIIEAHGGMERWNGYQRVDATIVSGGGFFPLKGVPQDTAPRQMTVWLHDERSSVLPYGAPDQRTVFTPERIAIEKLDGTVVAERRAPKDSFAGHQMNTPWDALQRAYFNGEALWTYVPYDAVPPGHAGRFRRGNRPLEGRYRDVARAAGVFSRLHRNAQLTISISRIGRRSGPRV
jgi:hypothetical protein